MKRSLFVGLVLALAFGPALAGQTRQAGPFSDAALIGTYAATESGDGSVSAGVGVVHYDGEGGLTRKITVNAPAEGGSRRILIFEATGQYTVNPDGTGVITQTNKIDNTQTTTVTFDFVITKAETVFVPGLGRRVIATELAGTQREAGVTVSLVESQQSRIGD